MNPFSQIGAKMTRSCRMRLDLVQHRLALLPVGLPGLPLEEILDLGQRRRRRSVPSLVASALDARGRVAARALRAAARCRSSFFSPRSVRNAARSIVLTRVRMPIAPRLPTIASAIEK